MQRPVCNRYVVRWYLNRLEWLKVPCRGYAVICFSLTLLPMSTVDMIQLGIRTTLRTVHRLSNAHDYWNYPVSFSNFLLQFRNEGPWCLHMTVERRHFIKLRLPLAVLPICLMSMYLDEGRVNKGYFSVMIMLLRPGYVLFITVWGIHRSSMDYKSANNMALWSFLSRSPPQTFQ